MWSKRQEVDYALQRRNTLRTLQGPQRAFARAEACDADPPLVRAALHHGEPHPVDCPVCGLNCGALNDGGVYWGG